MIGGGSDLGRCVLYGLTHGTARSWKPLSKKKSFFHLLKRSLMWPHQEWAINNNINNNKKTELTSEVTGYFLFFNYFFLFFFIWGREKPWIEATGWNIIHRFHALNPFHHPRMSCRSARNLIIHNCIMAHLCHWSASYSHTRTHSKHIVTLDAPLVWYYIK